jgi:hypothetical protein
MRGAFGAVFRRFVCHDPKAERNGCEFHASWPYAHIFGPIVPPDAERLRLNRDIHRRNSYGGIFRACLCLIKFALAMCPILAYN